MADNQDAQEEQEPLDGVDRHSEDTDVPMSEKGKAQQENQFRQEPEQEQLFTHSTHLDQCLIIQ